MGIFKLPLQIFKIHIANLRQPQDSSPVRQSGCKFRLIKAYLLKVTSSMAITKFSVRVKEEWTSCSSVNWISNPNRDVEEILK